MRNPPRNIAASVRQRLLNLSRKAGVDYNQILTRYAIERLLYRLGRSRHRDSFVLKGAMLFAIWEGSPHRPTRDLDLLGFGDRSLEQVKNIFRDICATPVEDDGITFDGSGLVAEEIRTTEEYGGVRLRFTASIGGAILHVQVDIGFGDAVTPAPLEADYPTLLKDQNTPRVRVYPRETVVAEKLEAIVKLGMLNTRFKDYHDLQYLADHFEFDGRILGAAIKATFDRRGTALPSELPEGLSDSFAADAVKQAQWKAFAARQPAHQAVSLHETIETISRFVGPPLLAISHQRSFDISWNSAGGWTK